MKLSSFLEVSSSPEYVTELGLKFAPHLAIQAAASDKWANCFVSRKMKHPWFKLRFKSVTSIFNVRLGVRDQPGGNVPADFNLLVCLFMSTTHQHSKRKIFAAVSGYTNPQK